LTLITLLSCRKPVNLFRTGTLSSKNYCDTLFYDKNNEHIVLPVIVNGKPKKVIFDTGADFIVFPNDSSDSKIKCNLTDAYGNVSQCNVMLIQSLGISNKSITNLYSINVDHLPAPFLCSCDGLIGNNVIKSSNWLIDESKLVFSNRPFDVFDKQVTLNIFYYDSNRLFSNVIINDNMLDTCLFDYGGNFDIQLPYKYYEHFKESFKPNRINNKISTSYGVNGISAPDTVLSINCNVNFNGIQIDSVNIDFVKKGEKRLGYIFLKRFNKVVINNTTNQLLIDTLRRNTNYTEPLYLFDWIDGHFVVSRTIVENKDVKIGDRYDEINSAKGNSFSDYCDFLKWRDSLMSEEWLYLRTNDNEIIRINNRR
jgi:hypothetical protein